MAKKKAKKGCLYRVVGFGLKTPRTFKSPAAAQSFAAERRATGKKTGRLQRVCSATALKKNPRLPKGFRNSTSKKTYVPTYSVPHGRTGRKVFRGADAVERAIAFAKTVAKKSKKTSYVDQGARFGFTSYVCQPSGRCSKYHSD